MKKAKRKPTSPRNSNAIDEFIGIRMASARHKTSRSRQDLGRFVSASSEIRNWKETVFSAGRLFDICKALNVSLSSMFERDPKGVERRKNRPV
jgi:hypothetical protein